MLLEAAPAIEGDEQPSRGCEYEYQAAFVVRQREAAARRCIDGQAREPAARRAAKPAVSSTHQDCVAAHGERERRTRQARSARDQRGLCCELLPRLAGNELECGLVSQAHAGELLDVFGDEPFCLLFGGGIEIGQTSELEIVEVCLVFDAFRTAVVQIRQRVFIEVGVEIVVPLRRLVVAEVAVLFAGDHFGFGARQLLIGRLGVEGPTLSLARVIELEIVAAVFEPKVGVGTDVVFIVSAVEPEIGVVVRIKVLVVARALLILVRNVPAEIIQIRRRFATDGTGWRFTEPKRTCRVDSRGGGREHAS